MDMDLHTLPPPLPHREQSSTSVVASPSTTPHLFSVHVHRTSGTLYRSLWILTLLQESSAGTSRRGGGGRGGCFLRTFSSCHVNVPRASSLIQIVMDTEPPPPRIWCFGVTGSFSAYLPRLSRCHVSVSRASGSLYRSSWIPNPNPHESGA